MSIPANFEWPVVTVTNSETEALSRDCGCCPADRIPTNWEGAEGGNSGSTRAAKATAREVKEVIAWQVFEAPILSKVNDYLLFVQSHVRGKIERLQNDRWKIEGKDKEAKKRVECLQDQLEFLRKAEGRGDRYASVSYTHLTLPTICSV